MSIDVKEFICMIMTNHGIGHGMNSFRVEFRGRIGLLVMMESPGDSCHQRGPGFESEQGQSWDRILHSCGSSYSKSNVCMYVSYI